MFCNQCGKQVETFEQYCKSCGGSLKSEREALHVSENQFKFCKECGVEVNGGYCGTCGTSALQLSAQMKGSSAAIAQLKQAGTFVKQSLPKTSEEVKIIQKEMTSKVKGMQKEVTSKVKAINMDMSFKEEITGWVKSALQYSGIAAVFGFIVTFLLGYIIQMAYWENYMGDYSTYMFGYDGMGSKLKKAYETIFNCKIWIFNLLFNGQIEWNVTLGNAAKGKILLSLPLFGILFGVLIFWISAKIISKNKETARDWKSNAVMSVVCGIVFATISLVMTKSIKLSSDDLYYLTYSSMDYDMIKLSTKVNFLSTFCNVSLLSFFTLTFVAISQGEKQNSIISVVRKVMGLFLGFSTLLSAGIILRVIMETGGVTEGSEVLTLVGLFIYLIGFILSCMLTGNFKWLEIAQDSDSMIKLKMSLTKMSYEYNGYSDSDENVLKGWFILLTLITIISLLAVAYHYWNEQKCDIKQAAIKGSLISAGVGFVLAMLTKMSQASIVIQAKIASEYRYGFGMSKSKYAYKMLSGDTSVIQTTIGITIIAFILFMLMYGVWSMSNVNVERAMSYVTMQNMCLVMLVFVIIFMVMIDFDTLNEASLNSMMMAFERVEDSISNITNMFWY